MHCGANKHISHLNHQVCTKNINVIPITKLPEKNNNIPIVYLKHKYTVVIMN